MMQRGGIRSGGKRWAESRNSLLGPARYPFRGTGTSDSRTLSQSDAVLAAIGRCDWSLWSRELVPGFACAHHRHRHTTMSTYKPLLLLDVVLSLL